MLGVFYRNLQGYGKDELVGLITRQKPKGPFGWLDLARGSVEGPVRVRPKDMDMVYMAVIGFKQTCIRCGENSLEYYLPAIDAIEQAHAHRDYDAFKEGSESLLGKIGDD